MFLPLAMADLNSFFLPFEEPEDSGHHPLHNPTLTLTKGYLGNSTTVPFTSHADVCEVSGVS